jgi:hypothetical protein
LIGGTHAVSLITDIYPEDNQTRNRDQMVAEGAEDVETSFFDEVPTNVLPAPSLLITPFLDSIMKRKIVDAVIETGGKAAEVVVFEEDMKVDVPVAKLDAKFLASLFV